jgi:parallel beta-helix repeat protein
VKIFAAILSALMVLAAAQCRADGPLYYDKGSIDKDTTWSGTVVLRGQNVVKKGATLTILPGTVIKFVWIDDDGDNIGDGELNVEGRIIARGTKDKMITFTSAQDKPKMKDWTFLMISVNKDSVVEYCKFEYAFTGVQVHYSTATIRNCLIQHNFEGIRFSTTDVVIEHNDIINNTYGIRYEARGSKTTVSDNLFKGNDYAFFPLQKCTSTVKIKDNDIEDSVHYNVNMGDNQRADLDYSGNWWGTADRAAIEGALFDKGKDETLGRVIYEPFLNKPADGAGMQ